MNLHDVEKLARAELKAAGLDGTWRIAWDNARRRAGNTRYLDHTISFSMPLMSLYEPDVVREVILHEIAHAIVGPHHGHDAVWAATARRLGSTGRTSLPGTLPKPPATWVGHCPNGHKFERYRRPSNSASCSRCNATYDERYVIAWKRAA
ncbi:MAG TPA: SprT-like domain-containing protein [Actinomycetaceae bacterium]|nr:SprT-like domain-containing protein [Actinomycetaceae bacterium]